MQPVIVVITIHKALTEMLGSLFLTVRVPIFSINTTPTKIIIHVLQFVDQTKGSVPLTDSGTMHLLVRVEIENEHFYITPFPPIGIGVGIIGQCGGIHICLELSRMIFHFLKLSFNFQCLSNNRK